MVLLKRLMSVVGLQQDLGSSLGAGGGIFHVICKFYSYPSGAAV